MRINVAQQLKDSLGDTRYYSIDEITREGFQLQGELKLIRTDRSILVVGRFGTVVSCACGRCLETFECPLEFGIEEEYFPAGDMRTSPVAEDVDGFVIGGDHILDISEAVRQNILIELPSMPLCQVECRGLCHKCGHNLNYGPCHCVGEQGDSHWTPLRVLLSTEIAGDKKRG